MRKKKHVGSEQISIKQEYCKKELDIKFWDNIQQQERVFGSILENYKK